MDIDQAPQTTAAPDVSSAAPETTSEPTQVELDGLSEFTFQGEKYTPDRLHKMFTEHKTYSQQAGSWKEQEKYDKNLETDLDSVLQDPRLAEKFKQVYPQKYHGIVDRLLRDQRQVVNPSVSAQPALPKEFVNEFGQVKERLKFFEERAHQAEVASASAKLDSLLPPIFEKYSMAIEDQVYSRAEQLLAQGQKLTDKTWERLARESHEGAQKRADQFYGQKLKLQMDKGRSGRDVGPGGATPGQAPNKPRTLEEAREAMIEHLKGGGR